MANIIILEDLDDLNEAIERVRRFLDGEQLRRDGHYRVEIRLRWPLQGLYHLDAEVFLNIFAKEMHKLGLDMGEQILSCGIHQVGDHHHLAEVNISTMEKGGKNGT